CARGYPHWYFDVW
nr:immunoglobulin heavy chain junction region [Mus musculus]